MQNREPKVVKMVAGDKLIGGGATPKMVRGRAGGRDSDGTQFPAKAARGSEDAFGTPARGFNLPDGVFKSARRSGQSVEYEEDVDVMEESDDEQALNHAKASVVRIFCTHSEPNFALPWTISKQRSSTSTGWILRYNRVNFICTNAHSVTDSAVVEVRRYGDDAKFLANVLCVCPDGDLAILEVVDPSFWRERTDEDDTVIAAPQPLKLRKVLPRLREEVSVIGFPVGGDNLSVTSGIVSRVDLQDYSNGSLSLLAVQIDAAINPGNSGGPVVDDEMRCVGVAFQTLNGEELQSLGYIIPTEVVIHFLEDYKRHSRYTGFGDPNFDVQLLENPSMREYYNVGKGGCGVVIKRLEPTADSSKVLKIGDVLMKVEGKKVGFDGTIQLRKGERIPFQYLMTTKFVGESTELDIIRDGKEQKVSMILDRDLSIIRAHPRTPPEYYVIGGLVFVPLTEKFLSNGFGDNWADGAPTELVWSWLRQQKETPDQQIIVLTQVLANALTGGYQEIQCEIVWKFNGKKIRNLKHMVDMVTKTKDQYLRWDLSQDDCVIVDRQKAIDITPECLRVNMIGADRHLLEPLPPVQPMQHKHDKDKKKVATSGNSPAEETGTEVDNTMEGGLAKSKPKRKRKRHTSPTSGEESPEEDNKLVAKRGRPRKGGATSAYETAEDTDVPKSSRGRKNAAVSPPAPAARG